jgi:hypothetical protein
VVVAVAFVVVWVRKRKVGREFDDGVGRGGGGFGEGAAKVTPFNPFEEQEWDPGSLYGFAPVVSPEPDDRGGHARKSSELSGTSSSGSPAELAGTQSHHRQRTIRTVGGKSTGSGSSYSQRLSGEEWEGDARSVGDVSGRGGEGRVHSPSASTAGSGPAASERREGQGVGVGEREEVVEIPPTYDSIPKVKRSAGA